jgi:hypothetical protein
MREIAEELTPPVWAETLLRLVLKSEDRDSVSGDLLEEYRESVRAGRDRLAANRWYVRHLARCADSECDRTERRPRRALYASDCGHGSSRRPVDAGRSGRAAVRTTTFALGERGLSPFLFPSAVVRRRFCFDRLCFMPTEPAEQKNDQHSRYQDGPPARQAQSREQRRAESRDDKQ